MAIKLKNTAARASFSDDFLPTVQAILHKRFAEIKAQYELTPVEKVKEELAISARYLSENYDGNLRAGEEYLKMMFYKQAGFIKFATGRHNDKVFLRGLTKEVIVKTQPTEHSQWKPYANIGAYEVIMFMETLERGVNDVHLIPVKRSDTNERHYHHKTKGEGHPLDRKVDTCISGFASIQSRLARVGDLPLLFGTWHLFLSRYNTKSPWPSCKTLEWEERIYD